MVALGFLQLRVLVCLLLFVVETALVVEALVVEAVVVVVRAEVVVRAADVVDGEEEEVEAGLLVALEEGSALLRESSAEMTPAKLSEREP